MEDAMRSTLRHAVDYHGHEGRSHLADVLAPGPPMIAEVHDSNIELEEDDNLYLSQAVRQYHADYGLEEGDNIVVTMIGDGVWHATAVFSDNDVVTGSKPEARPPARMSARAARARHARALQVQAAAAARRRLRP